VGSEYHHALTDVSELSAAFPVIFSPFLFFPRILSDYQPTCLTIWGNLSGVCWEIPLYGNDKILDKLLATH